MRTLPGIMTYRNLHPVGLLNGHANERPELAEAPCSINGHANINGMTVQVTGRGFSGEEAASNFRHTLAAIQPVPVEPAPRTREQRLAALLTCGLGKAAAKQDWPLIERLSKAAALVLSGAVQMGDRPGLVCIRSQANPETWYEVEAGHCSCPDAQKHQERACKHRLAMVLEQRLG